MTTHDSTKDTETGQNLEKLEANLQRIEELSQRLVSAMGSGRKVPTSLQGPNPDLYVKAAGAYASEMMNNPAKMIESHVAFWASRLNTTWRPNICLRKAS